MRPTALTARQRGAAGRLAQSLTRCKIDPRWVQCKLEVVAVTQYLRGWYWARDVEASLFLRCKRETGQVSARGEEVHLTPG